MLTLLVLLRAPPQRPRGLETIKLLFGLAIGLGLPFDFITTTEFNKQLGFGMVDRYLLGADVVLFQNFERGTISLNLDKSVVFNPTTFLGKATNDFFEVVYISFYVRGYASYFFIVLQVLWLWWKWPIASHGSILP